ncbi:MAG: S9 family peptidase, partial [Candidatus Eremiobacteraeota bacterium]|nr:S9 family peptidase [Candidatus Eremiobacteraeota bacterium]
MRLLFCLALMALPMTALADPPASKKVDQTDVYHGVTVKDPYRWLEDAEAKDTQDWVKRQNEYTRAHLDDSPVRAQLIERLTKLWDYPRYSSPFHRGQRYFFFKNDGLQNQAVFYVQEGLEGEPRVAIDPNKLSDDGTTALSDVEVSDDGKLCAYAVSVHGSDWQEVYVRDLDTGKDLSDKLEWCKFTSIAWTPDNTGFFYSRFPDPATVAKEDQTNYNRVYYHRVGDAQADDQLVFKDDEKKHLGYSAWVTEAGDYVGLTVWDGTDPRNRVYVRKVE